jgi:hypothetical protein
VQQTQKDGRPRCCRCGDVIGVYEPMILLSEGRPRSTSRLAEQHLHGPLNECYHDACYSHGQDEPGSAE